MSKKIGIIGGTFNPIHCGHLLIAETAYDQFGLDEIVFLPTGRAPHKEFMGQEMITHRCRMIEMAIADNPHFTLSPYETEQSGTNYTCRTLDYFHSVNPDADLYFIIGADTLFDLKNWYHPEGIMRKATLLCSVRKDLDVKEVDAQIDKLESEYNAVIHRMISPNFDVSSRNIRERVQKCESIRYLVPEPVRQYIMEKELYFYSESETEQEPV